MPEDLVKSLWILHKSSGVCLYHKQFETREDFDVDTDLFGGLVSALLSFSQEVSKGKAALKEIHLGPLKIVYDDTELIIVSMAFTRKAPEGTVSDLLKQVTNRFLAKFANRLPPAVFDNCVTPYKAFEKDVSEIYAPSGAGGGKEIELPREGLNFTEDDYASFNATVRQFLKNGEAKTLNGLDESLVKKKGGEEKKVTNTLQLVQTFANKLGIDKDFEPLFRKIRANTLSGDEGDYAALQR